MKSFMLSILVLSVVKECLQIPVLKPDDALSDAHDVIGAVLKDTIPQDCTIAFITDGSVHYVSLRQFSVTVGDKFPIAIFDDPFSKRSQRQGHRGLKRTMRQLKKLQESTNCFTIIIPSNDKQFLHSIIGNFYDSALLTWPVRVLIVSRIPISEMEQIYKQLSYVNGMVITIEDDSDVQRYSIYVQLPYSLETIQIASWQQIEGFYFHTQHRLFPAKFNRFENGAHLLVAGDHYAPHSSVKVFGDQNKETYEIYGPMTTLLSNIAAIMNFTYTLRRSPDGSWGYVLRNMSATGMVGLLARKEVDIALGPFALTENRAQVLDYTTPLFVDYCAIIAKLGDIEVDVWGFVKPWAPSVWSSVFITFFGVVVTVLVLIYVTKDNGNTSLFNYIAVLLQQGAKAPVRRWWERLILMSWIFTTMVLVQSYSGNLMSLLAVRYIPQPYQILEDVTQDGKIRMIWEANTAYIHSFMNAKSGILQELAQAAKDDRMRYVPATSLATELDLSMMEGTHVMMAEKMVLKKLMAEHFTGDGRCNFYLAKEKFLPFQFALAVQKHSPLKRVLDRSLMTITESGIYDYLTEATIPNSTACLDAPTKTVVKSSLSISNIWGIFMILVIGNSVGLCVLCFERILHRKYKERIDLTC